MESIGITGGSGFIGKHLIKKLEEKFFFIRSFEGDITMGKDLEGFFDGCDIVIHLAGIFSNDFDKLLQINVVGTKNVVDACLRSNVKKIIFSSSGAVYGEPVNEKSSETDPTYPNTLYGLSKLFSEEYIRFSGINYIILRFPNVYGPGNKKGVIYDFFRSIQEENKVIIYGTGEQKRDFLFIDDAIRAIITSVKHHDKEKIFNISTGNSYSLNDITVLYKKIGMNFSVEKKEIDESNMLQVLSEDVKKAKNILNWSSQIDIEDGILLMKKFYEKY